MAIKLRQELMITSDKTIDGRGASVHIAKGAGLTIQFVHNVIIHNIRIHHIISTSGGMIRDTVNHIGIRTVSDGDGISIFGSNHIWIDHCTLSQCTDGLIDAIMASTAITISNRKLNHHNDVMLLLLVTSITLKNHILVVKFDYSTVIHNDGSGDAFRGNRCLPSRFNNASDSCFQSVRGGIDSEDAKVQVGIFPRCQ